MKSPGKLKLESYCFIMNRISESPLSDRRVLEIDLKKVTENFLKIREAVSGLGVMAVLKANAYGLGLRPIAECLCEAGAARFGVADLHEALQIVDLGKPVQILGAILNSEIAEALEHDIILPVTDLEIAQRISEQAQSKNIKAKVELLIDTGMGRLGLLESSAEKMIAEIEKLPSLDVQGIYTHMPSAYDDFEYSSQQVQRFLDLLLRLPRTFRHVHMANSDGINNIEAVCRAPFTMVRTGINLYGYFDDRGQRRVDLQPVICLRSKLLAVRRMPAGLSIGYGREVVLSEDELVGTVAIGYADGFPIHFGEGGEVLVAGQRCPVLGRVSMDYTTISLKKVSEAKVGDDVLCLAEGLNLDTWANARGTMNYEALCAIGARVQRKYI